MKRYIFFTVLGVAASIAPLLAHHSFAAEFDSKKPVELKGTLVELEWVNPHAWIHMDVTDESGKVTRWDCELGSPNLLMRNGWRKDVLKKGDVIIVSGAQAKNASNLASARTVTFVDGKRVFNAGSSGEPGSPGAPTQ